MVTHCQMEDDMLEHRNINIRLEEEKRNREYRERQRDDTEKIIRAVLNSVNSIFARQMKIDDPVIRYSLFVDKLSISLDVLFGVMSSVLHDDKYPYSDDILSQTEKVKKLVQDELDNLMNYMRSPSYDPDAPYGKKLVENMSTKFQQYCSNTAQHNHLEHYSHHPTDSNLE